MSEYQASDGRFARILFPIVAIVCLLYGLGLAISGAILYFNGGTVYYVIAGLLFILLAYLCFVRGGFALWVALLLAVYTILWSLWEVGFTFYPSIPRLATTGGILLLVFLAIALLPKTERSGAQSSLALACVAAIALGFCGLVYGLFTPHDVIRYAYSSPATPITPASFGGANAKDWKAYGGTSAGTRYVPFDQIKVSNVGKLKEAWRIQTGDPGTMTADDENTPLAVGGKVYICTPHNIVIALDGTTGKELWRFDPKAQAPFWQRCRGVSYFDASIKPQIAEAGTPPTSGLCVTRLLTNTIDGRLYALDAETGKPCPDFGTDGHIDLRENMGPVQPGLYMVTAAPTVAGNVVIVGGMVLDNYDVNVPSGVVRGFSAVTGKLVWAWDMSDPSITKEPPPGKSYSHSTPNVWTTPAFDPDLGLVYLPTGNASPDLWGGNRTPTEERYSSSIVALDIATGRERWHFQTVHHDIWDYDVPAQPALVDIPDGKGGTVPGLIQLTKRGQIFYLDRRTGTPVADVVEKAAPVGALSGDWTALTQPYSVGMPTVGTDKLSEQTMWGATPFDHIYCRNWFLKSWYEGEFTPQSERGTLLYPSNVGGFNWGSATVDEKRGLLIVNDMRVPMWMALIKRDMFNGVVANPALQNKYIPFGFPVPMYGAPYGVLRTEFFSPLGVPCNSPPYGTYTAINLLTKKIVWQIPAGTVQDAGPLGIKTHLPMPVGMPTLGGGVTTGGGLTFTASAMDYALRGFNTETGEEVWKARLPVGSQGTPVSYIASNGKQYLVLTVGGNRSHPSGDRADYVIAYTIE